MKLLANFTDPEQKARHCGDGMIQVLLVCLLAEHVVQSLAKVDKLLLQEGPVTDRCEPGR